MPFGNFVGVQRLGRHKQQGIDLPHGAVDAPAAAHFAKMQNEALGEGRQVHGVFLLNFQYFMKIQKLQQCRGIKKPFDSVESKGFQCVVPEAGIEPARLAAGDFESHPDLSTGAACSSKVASKNLAKAAFLPYQAVFCDNGFWVINVLPLAFLLWSGNAFL